MTRFNAKIGAIVLAGLGAVYMVLALVLQHTAQADAPIDLAAQAADAGLDVFKTANLLLDQPAAVIVDIRPAAAFAQYHLPAARNLPDANAAALRELAAQVPVVVVVAAKDTDAAKRVAEARQHPKDSRFFYLQDGPRAWYLTFNLPASLFSDTEPPYGYAEALATLRQYFGASTKPPVEQARQALQTLARLNFQPSLLKATGKKPSSSPAKKKLSGGCG